MNRFNKLKKALTLAIGVFLLASCSKDNEETPIQPSYGMGLFNAYSAGTGVQVKYNNQNLFVSTGLPYGREYWTRYIWTTPGNVKLAAINPTTNQVLIDEVEISTKENELYTGLIYGNTLPAKFLFINDVAVESTDTKPRLRFLNLAENVGNVDVFLGTQKVTDFSNRAQETTSTATNSQKFILSPVTTVGTDIIVKDAAGNELVKYASYNLQANNYYTIILHGDKNVIEDADKKVKITVLIYN